MSEQRYRLEENNQTNELILWEDVKILNVFKSSYDNRKHLSIIVDKLNEQQATIKSKDKQLERLYNYFQDYLKDEMSGNAFSEMWDFVKEDESWEDE